MKIKLMEILNTQPTFVAMLLLIKDNLQLILKLTLNINRNWLQLIYQQPFNLIILIGLLKIW